MKHVEVPINPAVCGRELELQIARQCAPLLTGIKISNILITAIQHTEKVHEIFYGSLIKVKCIYRDENKITFLLYRQEELSCHLNQSEVKEFMVQMGYQDKDLDEILRLFSERFHSHMKYRDSFPHEMGILLGYPVTDVIGFMENQGRNYLYLGYWKVYGNLSEALHTFHRFKQAKALVTNLVVNGRSIHSVIHNDAIRQHKMDSFQMMAL